LLYGRRLANIGIGDPTIQSVVTIKPLSDANAKIIIQTCVVLGRIGRAGEPAGTGAGVNAGAVGASTPCIGAATTPIAAAAPSNFARIADCLLI
jgi:hypothetical protein